MQTRQDVNRRRSLLCCCTAPLGSLFALITQPLWCDCCCLHACLMAQYSCTRASPKRSWLSLVPLPLLASAPGSRPAVAHQVLRWAGKRVLVPNALQGLACGNRGGSRGCVASLFSLSVRKAGCASSSCEAVAVALQSCHHPLSLP